MTTRNTTTNAGAARLNIKISDGKPLHPAIKSQSYRYNEKNDQHAPNISDAGVFGLT